MSEREIVQAATAILDPNARTAYLDQACGNDAELRACVEELLRDAVTMSGEFSPDANATAAVLPSDGGTATFSPAVAAAMLEGRAAKRSPRREETGNVIAGRYTLIQAIGEGGMGSVYLAEQTEPVKRRVALKLIKSGMDSKAVLARFDAERQALALMDHPNIARVYDGGTTADGEPFFVMELVQGVPLTEYCDTNRLSIKARLELFVAICQAVQHAHQKGIIHRDLKPSNVLVTEVDGKPTPKVIDFGVAKAIEQQLTDLSFVDTGLIVGTPTYMSPEQANPASMDIDTRTDVYALGVMLYELLVGSPPLDARQFKRAAVYEMLRMVREVEPPRPSTKLSTADALPNIAANRSIEPGKLAKLLAGELDWVVMKSLEKDRTRRYETANGFARDVQRYLADEVVEARPPSRGYRLRKFVRRNKVQVLAGSLILLALIAGVIGTSLGMARANAQRQLAEAARTAEVEARAAEKTQYDLYRKSINFTASELRKPIESAIYTRVAQQEFNRTLTRFLNQSSVAENDVGERAKLTLKLREVENLQLEAMPNDAAIRQSLTEAVTLAERIVETQGRENDVDRLNLAVCYSRVGAFEQNSRRFPAAAENYAKAVAITEQVIAKPNTTTYTATDLKRIHGRHLSSLAFMRFVLNEIAAALDLFARTEQIFNAIPAAERDAEISAHIGTLHYRYAQVLQQARGGAGSQEHLRLSVEAYREWVTREPTNLEAKRQLARALDRLGDDHFYAQQNAEAQTAYREATALTRDLSTPEELLELRRMHSLHLYKAATVTLRLGDRAASGRLYDECLALREELMRARPQLSSAKNEWTLALARCGKTTEASTQAEALLKAAAAQKAGTNAAIRWRIISAFTFAICADTIDRTKPATQWTAEQRTQRKTFQDRAIQAIEAAIAANYNNRSELENDPDLDGLRDDSRFAVLIEKLPNRGAK